MATPAGKAVDLADLVADPVDLADSAAADRNGGVLEPKLPLFWQMILASEASPYKVGLVLQDIAQTRLDPIGVLRTSPHFTPAERERIANTNPVALEKALNQGAHLWFPGEYSEVLQSAGQTPPALFVRGSTESLQKPTVAIVGTRNGTTYGKAVAQKFSEHLAQAGVTIASGGAYGIDVAAHQGALSVGGSTVAVVATGVDIVYPHAHAGIFSQIAENGAIISQWACGTKPDRYRFLMRNELMAALSDAVLVIEAPEKSGALRTAGAAADLNRPVFVVPGNISYQSFRGSHALIRDGAMLVDHPDQILETLGLEALSLGVADFGDLPEVQQKILSALGDEPISGEAIVVKTGLDASEVLSELTLLELDGLILRDGIGYARKP